MGTTKPLPKFLGTFLEDTIKLSTFYILIGVLSGSFSYFFFLLDFEIKKTMLMVQALERGVHDNAGNVAIRHCHGFCLVCYLFLYFDNFSAMSLSSPIFKVQNWLQYK